MNRDFPINALPCLVLISLLLGMGCQPTSNPVSGPADEKLLAAASNNGEVGVKDALNAGANPDVHNEFGVTPLMLAALNGNAKITQMLLAAGAKVNLVDQEGWSALMKAVPGVNLVVVELLCQKGADTNTRLPDGTHVLSKVFNTVSNEGKVWPYLSDEHLKLISLLINHGAQPDANLVRRIDETLQAHEGSLAEVENLRKARKMLTNIHR